MSTTIPQPVESQNIIRNSCEFYVIGIGFSDGGIEPLQTILADLPADLPAAVVLLYQGSHPSSGSWAKNVQRISPIPVIALDDHTPIQPKYVYLPADGQIVRLQKGMLSVEAPSPRQKNNRYIDLCFATLAADCHDKSIGVILSGTSYDGIEGCKAIEARGGMVLVQDPATAQFPLMPVALIANDNPDYILDPHEIADYLVQRVRS
jgi:two-component system, chemotaxis family, protein-glutamate methylesterase/glutaminase